MTRCGVKPSSRGATLLEVVVGVGLLAVVIPIVASAMLQSGLSSRDAQAETRSAWMVPLCLDEWRNHQSAADRDLVGDSMVFALNRHGHLLGVIDEVNYQSGLRSHGDESVFYLAKFETRPALVGDDSMLHITIEYPSALPLSRRNVVPFITHVK